MFFCDHLLVSKPYVLVRGDSLPVLEADFEAHGESACRESKMIQVVERSAHNQSPGPADYGTLLCIVLGIGELTNTSPQTRNKGGPFPNSVMDFENF